MLLRLHKRGAALLAVILAVVGLGFTTPALGTETSEGSVPYTLAEAFGNVYLTKVIDATPGYQASQDTYTFQFVGRGKAASSSSCAIADFSLTGADVPTNETGENASLKQIAVRVSLAEIFNGAGRTAPQYPSAGIYEYVVQESSATNNGGTSGGDPVYVNKSNAEYILRVYAKNQTVGETETVVVDGVTVEKIKDDDGEYLTDESGHPMTDAEGNPAGVKVDPGLPKIDGTDSGVITEDGVPEHNQGSIYGTDGRGRDVNGFTFANEYVSGGPVTLKKQTVGDYADKTQKFRVSITIHDNAAIDGAAISYKLSNKDNDLTEGKKDLSGVNSYSGDSMIEFAGGKKEVTITALLANDEAIYITGLWGTDSGEAAFDNHIAEDDEPVLDRRIRFTSGLKQGTRFVITEKDFGKYEPSTSVTWVKTPTNSMPVEVLGMDEMSSQYQAESHVAEDGANITLTNKLYNTKVDRTGIIINNLPYVLMVGVPLVVFALLFVAKRRSRTDA